MWLIRGLYNLRSEFTNGCVATIGNYDGVHLGHQKVLDFAKRAALELKLPLMVIIFEPYPEEFFTGKRLLRLTNLREKLVLLGQQGVAWVLLLSFNAHFAEFTAKRFITEVLVKRLLVKYLVIGDDFVFGHKREGDYSLLKQEGKGYGFQVKQIPSFKIDGVRVSSSLIRIALMQGDLEIAAKFLGRPYTISGRIVHGDHLGRDLGFPTANIYLRKRKPPLPGVYAVKIYGLVKEALSGIANIGFRPTVGGKYQLFEVYIFDFNSDIYGKIVTVEFCKRIRDEEKFDSLTELQVQIRKDIEVVKSV